MPPRFFSLWFRHLTTDYVALRRPALLDTPFVLAAPDHGRMIITAINREAHARGIDTGMAVADARILVPSLEVVDDPPGLSPKLLTSLARWCIRYTPIAAIDPPDGLILNISGCSHLWGGEREYLRHIITTLRSKQYDTRGAIADTIGAAWAMARYGRKTPIVDTGQQTEALLSLPVSALRLDPLLISRLQRLGLFRIHHIAGMPRQSLRSRFGNELLLRIDQAFGRVEEVIQSVEPIVLYQERLSCLEPILTAGGIGIALTRLLETLCKRLQQDGKGLRSAIFKCYRVDGKIVEIAIGTARASQQIQHLFKLFEEKIPTLEPDLGIEVFTLDAPKVEDLDPLQRTMWSGACGLDDIGLAELVDRIENKTGSNTIHRYLPAEHYWPERALQPALNITDKLTGTWPAGRPRPIHILPAPEPIVVAAPIPDYPPMHFRYRNKLHKIIRAEGPERIEQEWWIDGALHRDYYCVEDEAGARYWIFRSGHYTGGNPAQWFLHGFFA